MVLGLVSLLFFSLSKLLTIFILVFCNKYFVKRKKQIFTLGFALELVPYPEMIEKYESDNDWLFLLFP